METGVKPKVLIIAPNKARVRTLAQSIEGLPIQCHTATEDSIPRELSDYKLLILELGQKLKRPEPLLNQIGKRCHVVLIIPELDLRWIAYYMLDPRINHFLDASSDLSDLKMLVGKLSTGAIFGLDWYLKEQASVQYRRIQSYKGRLAAMENFSSFLAEHKARNYLKRTAERIIEELLMNAMYQAPVDPEGKRIFSDVEPRQRIRRKTPQPVSLRYVYQQNTLCLSVRDRYGSFERNALAQYLLRCTTSEIQLENKKLGAGLGLYLIASTTSKLVVNVLPKSLCEFVCIIEGKQQSKPLKLLSVTTQRPVKSTSRMVVDHG